MSHFSVLVFSSDDTNSVEDLLAPYDENIVVAPYIKYTRQQAIDDERKQLDDFKQSPQYLSFKENPDNYINKHGDNKKHIEYLQNFDHMYETITDDELYEMKAEWFSEDNRDADGNLWSTYNPNSKWDYWTYTSRWGDLVTKDGDEVSDAFVTDIKWDKNSIPFAYVDMQGRWHERGNMGWWAIVTDEKDADDWENEFMDYIKSLPDNAEVYAVDCHI